MKTATYNHAWHALRQTFNHATGTVRSLTHVDPFADYRHYQFKLEQETRQVTDLSYDLSNMYDVLAVKPEYQEMARLLNIPKRKANAKI